MKQAKIISVGKEAIVPQDKMIILFDETATKDIKKVAIIQSFETGDEIHLDENSTISFGEQTFRVVHVGRLANANLNSIGHISLMFKEVPQEDTLLNAVYVEPYDLPVIEEGATIFYR